MRYRKKPVEVEAFQITPDNMSGVADWCGGKVVHTIGPHGDWIEVPTLEGTMIADIGSWIIKGVAGEFYPCKPEIFAATYEEA